VILLEKNIAVISSRIFERSKYWECLIKHRDEVLKAMFERDMCAIWKVLDECEIPCEQRWAIVKRIIEKAESPDLGGPQFLW